MLPWYPGYVVSDSGDIIGRRGREISPQVSPNGSVRYGVLDADGKFRLVRAGRMVCWYFNGPYPDDGAEYKAWHKDGDPGNNNYRNLEWRLSLRKQPREIAITKGDLPMAYLGQIPGMTDIWAFRRQVFDPQKLDRLMRERGVTGKQLSDSSGISTPSISEWLNGLKVPSARSILAVAVALDADVGDFLAFAHSET
jgi:DNA-binding Xre family transcriptional regulator